MREIEGEPGLIEAFRAQAPAGLDRALLVIVQRSYPAARQFCEMITVPEEDHDLRGHVKRAVIEGALQALPTRFPQVVERPVRNVTESHNHRELAFGDFVLTISHTQHARARLPDARFRDSLARPQASFFPYLDAQPPADGDGNLYAVVVHGSPRTTDLAPRFVHIVFPIPGGFHGVGIDLYARYPLLRPRPAQRPVFGEPAPELRTDIALPDEQDSTGSEG